MEKSKVYSILANLKLWQKVFVIAVLGFILIAVLFAVYVSEANKNVRAAQLELDGIRPLELVMLAIQFTQEQLVLMKL